MLIQLRQFMSAAKAEQRKALAKVAGTSVAHLYHLLSGHRKASAELAGRIEHAAATLRKDDRTLPAVKRSDICKACAECEYAKRCGA